MELKLCVLYYTVLLCILYSVQGICLKSGITHLHDVKGGAIMQAAADPHRLRHLALHETQKLPVRVNT